MHVIGVIDVMGGRAVRARGGIREHYAPVAAIGGTAIDGDPLGLARAYVEQFGLRTLYAADLDAIRGGEMQGGIISRLAAIGQLWIDAGISGAPSAQRVIDLGAARAVVGLETLSSFEALAAICDEVGGERVAFSLDLRGGEPLGLGSVVRQEPAHELAARAAGAGAGAIIMIDLARVGSAAGPDFDLLSRVRAAAPGAMLLAGGGVRGAADLTRLADLGCDGALVASALHDGALSASR